VLALHARQYLFERLRFVDPLGQFIHRFSASSETSASSVIHGTIHHAEPPSENPNDAVTASGWANGRRLPNPNGAARACWTARAITEFAEVPEFAEKRFRRNGGDRFQQDDVAINNRSAAATA
jgi:hypothetical protein